jgi:uncharacterized protein (TIRG00374 family)
VNNGRRGQNLALGLLGLAFSGVFLYLAARHLDVRTLRETWAAARPLPWVLVGVASYIAGHFVRGMRLRALVRREATLSWLTATNIVVIGYASNNVFPARLGELVRAGVLVERTGMPFAEALTITFIERLLDGIAILLLLLLATPFVMPAPWLSHLTQVGVIVFASALAVVIVGVLSPNVLLGSASKLAAPLGARWRDRALRATTHVINGGACLRDPRTAFSVSALSLLVWILEAGLFVSVLPAFSIAMRPATGALAMSVTNLGILVPSTPGYVGPFHFFCAQALSSQGVADGTALGYAFLVHIAFYVPITIWGAAAIFRYGIEVGATVAETRKARAAPAARDVEGVPTYLIAHVETPRALGEASQLNIALSEAFVGDCTPDAARDVAMFLDGQIAALPPRLQTMFHLGMTFFRVVVRIRHGSSFCALPVARRRAIVNGWAFGRIALLRQLFRPVRSLALLAYYERPDARPSELRVVQEKSRAIG